MGNRRRLVPQLWMCFHHLRDYRFWPLSRSVSSGKLSVLWCESYDWPTDRLLACCQPSLLGLCPILEYRGRLQRRKADPMVVLVIGVAGFVDQNSALSCFEKKNVVMGPLWPSIISRATMRFLWRDQQGKSLLQSITFFVIDVDIQQNAFLLNTDFFRAGPDHPCDESGSSSCCTLCNGEAMLVCEEQHCSTGEEVSLRYMQACKSTAIHSLGFIKLCVIWVAEHKGTHSFFPCWTFSPSQYTTIKNIIYWVFRINGWKMTSA